MTDLIKVPERELEAVQLRLMELYHALDRKQNQRLMRLRPVDEIMIEIRACIDSLEDIAEQAVSA